MNRLISPLISFFWFFVNPVLSSGELLCLRYNWYLFVHWQENTFPMRWNNGIFDGDTDPIIPFFFQTRPPKDTSLEPAASIDAPGTKIGRRFWLENNTLSIRIFCLRTASVFNRHAADKLGGIQRVRTTVYSFNYPNQLTKAQKTQSYCVNISLFGASHELI